MKTRSDASERLGHFMLPLEEAKTYSTHTHAVRHVDGSSWRVSSLKSIMTLIPYRKERTWSWEQFDAQTCFTRGVEHVIYTCIDLGMQRP